MEEEDRRKAAGCPWGRGQLPEDTRLLQGRQLLACPRTRHGPVRVRVGGRRRGRLLSGARPAARGGTRLLRWAAVAGMISQAQGIAGAGWRGVRETWDHSQA